MRGFCFCFTALFVSCIVLLVAFLFVQVTVLASRHVLSCAVCMCAPGACACVCVRVFVCAWAFFSEVVFMWVKA